MFQVEFDLWDGDDRCYVNEFLESLDPELKEKVELKLEDYERLSFGTLMKDEKLKKIEKGMHEVRIRIQRTNFRFLGTIRGCVMYLVLGFIKDTKATPREKIETARRRINEI